MSLTIILQHNRDEKRSIKSLPTKKVTVKGKNKVFIRNQHVNMNKAVKDVDYVDSLKDVIFSENKIKKQKEIEQGGRTEGVVRFEVDGKGVYFKPSSNEVFLRKDEQGLMRQTVKLRHKHNDKELTISELKNADPNDYKKYKGQLAHREELAYRLSFELGMNHLPPSKRRKIKGKYGTTTADVFSHYKSQYDEVIDPSMASERDFRGVMGLIEKDKHLGDKITLDYLMGNSDRHTFNIMVGRKGKDYEMIGIDHGLTFPDDNKVYMKEDFQITQKEFSNIKGNKIKITDKFVSDFTQQYDSEKRNNFINDVKEKIGHKEANAFHERVEKIKKSIDVITKKRRK